MYPKHKCIYKYFHRPLFEIGCLKFNSGYIYTEIDISFDRSFYMAFDDVLRKNDLSKVIGFSCGLNHHKESYRLAIKPCKLYIEVYPYIYQFKERFDYDKIAVIKYDERVRFIVAGYEDEVVMSVMQQGCDGYWNVKGRYVTSMISIPDVFMSLGMYVGGKYKNRDWSAPHKLKYTQYNKRKITNKYGK